MNRRVLIVRVGAMGDVLHALPAVAALRKAQPEWAVDWIVDERWLPLLHGGGWSGDGKGATVRTAFPVPVRAWKQAPLSAATLRAFAGFRRMRGEYDIVVDMQGTLRSAAIGRLAGGRTLTGYADPRERAAAWLYGKKIERSGTHVVEQGAALLSAACGVTLQPVVPELPHTPAADDWAAERVGDRKVAVLAAGAGWRAKQWPPERFAALAVALRERGYACIVNATRENDATAEEIAVKSEGAAEVAVCDVAGLLALLRRAALLVGGDTGPMHLAAALGVPLVALFGPTDPARNGPWGAGRMTVVRDASSITSYKRSWEFDPGLARVTVEQVMEAMRTVGA